jgi:hypothetical protein
VFVTSRPRGGMEGLREELSERVPDLIAKLDISNCVDDCLTTMALALESVTRETEQDFKYQLEDLRGEAEGDCHE